MKLLKLSEEAAKTLTVEQLAVLAVLANTPRKDYTSKFYCYQGYIAETLNYSISQVERIIKSLKAANLFTVTKERVTGSKEYRNLYQFEALDTQFILIDSKLLSSGLEVEEIGLLIKLKAFTVNNSLVINKSKEWIGKACGLGKVRFNRIIASLETKGLVNYESQKLTITSKMFMDTSERAARKAKQLNMWVGWANEYLEKAPKSLEAHQLRYYFIDKKAEVKNPVALLKRIITGLKAYDKTKEEKPVIIL